MTMVKGGVYRVRVERRPAGTEPGSSGEAAEDRAGGGRRPTGRRGRTRGERLKAIDF